MSKVTFKYRGEGLYLSDEKHWGDSYGDYYPAADYKALEAKLSALVEATERVVAYYDASLQGWKTDNYAEVIEHARAAIEAAKGKP